jgi:hypothetical protein
VQTQPPPATANPGFALGQIARCLLAADAAPDADARDRANTKAEAWWGVVRGMLAGILNVGSRTPVAGVPVWVTTEVAHGGFATGELAAGGPLQPHETALLADLSPVPAGRERAAINTHFLTEAGLSTLAQVLANGHYRVRVPEEGALLAVAWLARNGHAERARALLDVLVPFLDRLRFYPVPADTPPPEGPTVRVRTAAEVAGDLRAIRPVLRVEQQREAATIWLPLYDRVVSLFAETLDGPPPTLALDENGKPLRPGGKFVVEGGWPCAAYPDGWRERAAAALAEYRRLRERHRLCAGPESASGGFATLRRALEKCVADPKSLTGREVGLVRCVLAGVITRGGPGSVRNDERRRRQAHQAATPGTETLAAVAAARLVGVSSDEGLPEPDAYLGPVTADEAGRHGVPAGHPMPRAVCQRLRRCREGAVADLVEAGLIPSSEVLARVLPQVSAGVRAAAFADPELRRLYGAVYVAFRTRRSLLLLNLEGQARMEELPWVAALADFRSRDAEDVSRQALRQAVLLALTSFPQEIVPNKLLREFRSLATGARMRLPLVDELAADIFMGEFEEQFLLAAQTAAHMLTGTVYERYYRLPFARVREMRASRSRRFGKAVCVEFGRVCEELALRAGPRPAGVAGNGVVIEQQQLLTTHNLAVLYDALGLADEIGPQGEGLALRCFAWVCGRLGRLSGPWQTRLRAVKNAAYAWRQMVFFLSVAPAGASESFLRRAESQLRETPDAFRERFRPALDGLARAIAGSDPGRPFLGWCAGRHWLMG